MHPQNLLADDHPLIRKGLKLLIQVNLNFFDTSEVASCNELMKELTKRKYTHLVLDILLSDGNSLEVLPAINQLYPDLKILVYSMQPREVYGTALYQYGIEYYLPKTTPEEDTFRLLRRFLLNETPIRDEASVRYHNNPFAALAPRELEILHYLLKGHGTKEIAETLNIKMNTVSTVKNRIFDKTGTKNGKELSELASLNKVRH